MHIPDGFLDPKFSGGLAGIAALALSYCFARVKQMVTAVVPQAVLATAGKGIQSISTGTKRILTQYGNTLIMRIGMVASIIFVGQMFDFTIAAGTTGHFFGGIFAGAILGPFAATLAMAAVVVTQAVFLGDGGILALGANLVNMAVLGTLLSYYVYEWLKKKLPADPSLALAAWFSVIIAASAVALELGLSGKSDLVAALMAMFKAHALIGIAEAMVTLGLVHLFELYIKGENEA
jgi:cobalt/nickel transport system permease protein